MQMTMHLSVVPRMESIYPTGCSDQNLAIFQNPFPHPHIQIINQPVLLTHFIPAAGPPPWPKPPASFTPDSLISLSPLTAILHTAASDPFKHKSEHVSLLLKTLQKRLVSLHMKPVLFTWVYKVSWATSACTAYSLLAVFESHWSFLLHLKLA